MFKQASLCCLIRTKKGDSNFDIGMGSFHGAECCELVGLFLLSLLQNLKLNLGLYRDDVLGVGTLTARQIEQKKKEICQIFKQQNLSITIEANHKVVNFLDVTLDLNSGIYKPYMKPNDTPLYVNKKSNHPPSIIKNIPAAVNKRLCQISANEAVFNEVIPPYQNALKESGYEYPLKYKQATDNNNNKKRKRTRNITWFNPPYSENVSTNVGANFFKEMESCFLPCHPLYKIMNRNTIKLSYRCMPNMGQVLSRHNHKVVNQEQVQQTPPGFNCQGGLAVCPLNGACQTASLVYEATVTRLDNHIQETYTGLTERTFKIRYGEHKFDFRHQSKEHSSTLSTYIWKLKKQNIPYTISWQVITKSRSFDPTTRSCQLCLKEKYFIMFRPEGASLNKRRELYATCRHRLKPLLGNT